jgi:hypothetical protein
MTRAFGAPERDGSDVGQHVGADQAGTQRGSVILVNDSFDTNLIAVRPLYHRNAASACANHRHALLNRQRNDARFQYPQRSRRRHDAAPACPSRWNSQRSRPFIAIVVPTRDRLFDRY